jgi:hypothetical protein
VDSISNACPGRFGRSGSGASLSPCLVFDEERDCISSRLSFPCQFLFFSCARGLKGSALILLPGLDHLELHHIWRFPLSISLFSVEIISPAHVEFACYCCHPALSHPVPCTFQNFSVFIFWLSWYVADEMGGSSMLDTHSLASTRDLYQYTPIEYCTFRQSFSPGLDHSGLHMDYVSRAIQGSALRSMISSRLA